MLSHCACVMFSAQPKSANSLLPARLTRISSPPSSATVRSTIAGRPSMFLSRRESPNALRSSLRIRAASWSSCAAVRAVNATSAPCSARVNATPWPISLLAPVISAIFPCNEKRASDIALPSLPSEHLARKVRARQKRTALTANEGDIFNCLCGWTTRSHASESALHGRGSRAKAPTAQRKIAGGCNSRRVIYSEKASGLAARR